MTKFLMDGSAMVEADAMRFLREFAEDVHSTHIHAKDKLRLKSEQALQILYPDSKTNLRQNSELSWSSELANHYRTNLTLYFHMRKFWDVAQKVLTAMEEESPWKHSRINTLLQRYDLEGHPRMSYRRVSERMRMSHESQAHQVVMDALEILKGHSGKFIEFI